MPGDVSTFQTRWVAVLQGEHPFEIAACTSAVMKICTYAYGCHTATPPRNEHFPWEHYWQGFVCYYIAMAKPFLNSICCRSFVQFKLLFISSKVFPPLLGPYLLYLQRFHFLGVCPCSFQSFLSCNIYVSVSQSVSVSLDPAMRSMFFANHRNVSRSPTAIAMIDVTKSRTGNYDFCACARARGFPGRTLFGRTHTLRRVCRAITR